MSNHADNYNHGKAQDQTQMEQSFLRGKKDPALGIYSDIFSAKCGEGQDGGVVTALLLKGMEEGVFDAAIVVQHRPGYKIEVVVAQEAAAVSAARGTKYVRAQIMPKLRELIKQGVRRLAIVCTPCEVAAVRKIQQDVAVSCDITIIGLFCFEAFNASRLKQRVLDLLRVDLDSAKTTQIRDGKFMIKVEDREVSCKVKDLREAVEKACNYCDDFTSRLADVSVGSVGSKPGYSTVIVRSESGEKLVRNLDCVRDTVDKNEVVKLLKIKEERAKKSFGALDR